MEPELETQHKEKNLMLISVVERSSRAIIIGSFMYNLAINIKVWCDIFLTSLQSVLDNKFNAPESMFGGVVDYEW